MSPLPPPDGMPDTTMRSPHGGEPRSNGATATVYARTPAEIEVEIEALSMKFGFPIYRVSYDPAALRRIRVLTRAEQRTLRKRKRKAYRRAHPWTERWPNVARIVWWTLILAVVAFFVLADRIATYLPKH